MLHTGVLPLDCLVARRSACPTQLLRPLCFRVFGKSKRSTLPGSVDFLEKSLLRTDQHQCHRPRKSKVLPTQMRACTLPLLCLLVELDLFFKIARACPPPSELFPSELYGLALALAPRTYASDCRIVGGR